MEKQLMSGVITQEQIEAFAAAWYQALDFHVPTEEITTLVASDKVEMIFPEKTLPGVSDFIAWYSGGTYSDGEETVGVINIFFDENHNIASIETLSADESTAEVRVVVAWQASWFEPPAAKSKRVSADFTQVWTVRRSDKNEYGLEITSYNAVAEPPNFAPGFARL
jgi:hypothetical protein